MKVSYRKGPGDTQAWLTGLILGLQTMKFNMCLCAVLMVVADRGCDVMCIVKNIQYSQQGHMWSCSLVWTDSNVGSFCLLFLFLTTYFIFTTFYFKIELDVFFLFFLSWGGEIIPGRKQDKRRAKQEIWDAAMGKYLKGAKIGSQTRHDIKIRTLLI